MQVVHTFNRDISKQGTVEELPDTVAKTLIKTGRARPATEEEITNGHVASTEPAPDQLVATTSEPPSSAGTVATAADTPALPAADIPATEAGTAPANTAAPAPAKAEAKKPSGGSATSTTSTPSK